MTRAPVTGGRPRHVLAAPLVAATLVAATLVAGAGCFGPSACSDCLPDPEVLLATELPLVGLDGLAARDGWVFFIEGASEALAEGPLHAWHDGSRRLVYEGAASSPMARANGTVAFIAGDDARSLLRWTPEGGTDTLWQVSEGRLWAYAGHSARYVVAVHQTEDDDRFRVYDALAGTQVPLDLPLYVARATPADPEVVYSVRPHGETVWVLFERVTDDWVYHLEAWDPRTEAWTGIWSGTAPLYDFEAGDRRVVLRAQHMTFLHSREDGGRLELPDPDGFVLAADTEGAWFFVLSSARDGASTWSLWSPDGGVRRLPDLPDDRRLHNAFGDGHAYWSEPYDGGHQILRVPLP